MIGNNIYLNVRKILIFAFISAGVSIAILIINNYGVNSKKLNSNAIAPTEIKDSSPQSIQDNNSRLALSNLNNQHLPNNTQIRERLTNDEIQGNQSENGYTDDDGSDLALILDKKIEIEPSDELFLYDLLEGGSSHQEISTDSPKDGTNATMEDKFNSQNPDAIWASEEEYRYLSMFTEQESLANYALRSSECKKDMCKLIIALDAETDKEIVTQAVVNNLLKDKSSFEITLPTSVDGELAMFISNPKVGDKD